MKDLKCKSKSKHEKKSKKNKRKHKKVKYSDSESSTSASETELEWVEKPTSQPAASFTPEEQNGKQSEAPKREDWMSMKSLFPCVFNEKKTKPPAENDKPDLDKLGQSNRELNPYWKNGGTGVPEENARRAETAPVMDVNWLKKSLRRAKEQAEYENRSLEEIAAERWGSLEAIQSMISKAESASMRDKSNSSRQSRSDDKYGASRHSLDSSRSARYSRNDHYSKYDDYRSNDRQKQRYRKPTDDDCFESSYRASHSGRRNWQKSKPAESNSSTSESRNLCTSSSNSSNTDVPETREIHSNPAAGNPTSSNSNTSTNVPETEGSNFLTEEEMNKLGARIVKAEIMGDNELAEELKSRLKNAREAAKNTETRGTEKVQVILTQTDSKGNTRPLEPRDQTTSSQSKKRKNAETHASGQKVRHYFDDDKYSLAQLFQKEKGRSATEDDAEFVKVASRTMDMDEIFEERITRVQSDARQDERDRSRAIKEHQRLSKSLDNCQWCVDSKYMLKHMVVTMDSDICISLPQYTSLTPGHCIITPTHHVSCQLQLDENVYAKLKMYKQALYKMFTDQDQYPVFYEVYKARHKYSHMQLMCVPLPKEVGELAPIYFKKALLECETEWSMNKKIVDLEHKDVRQAIPNGLSYFMVEFERNKGYAHVIEDEQMFPKNFAEEIIGGMLDLDHDTWRRPRKENFDLQREKVLTFLETWKKYEDETKGFN